MILRFIARLKFWQIYAISLSVDLAIRLLRRFDDIKMLLTEPAGGWTVRDLLPAVLWIGFEASWAFVVAFIVHSYFARFRPPEEQQVSSGNYLKPGEENSSPR